MEFARLGNHLLTVCPYCDRLFECPVIETIEAGATDALCLLHEKHLSVSPNCKAQADAAPTLMEVLADLRPAYAEAEAKRQEEIDSNPDNGRAGFWLVEGIRHDARTRANNAREAIGKCSETVQSWESPTATFLGKELPEVF